MKIYEGLEPATQELVERWLDAEELWRWARTDLAWAQLVTSRETALHALRSDFRIATMDADHAATEVTP